MTTTITGTGKYEQLLERCRSLAAVPTAVAHPCEASALAVTAKEMNPKYKETSEGGLAVSLTLC